MSQLRLVQHILSVVLEHWTSKVSKGAWQRGPQVVLTPLTQKDSGGQGEQTVSEEMVQGETT
jgi:hypothetical protein